MGLLRTVILGRKDGIRASMLRRALGGGESGGTKDSAGRSAPPPVAVGEQSLSLGLEAPKDVTPPEGFEVVLHKDALPEGDMVEIIIGGKAIAVAKFEGAFYAIDNACPHADGPLGEGELNGPVVKCPYHGWEFDVRDGNCLTASNCTVTSFDVKVVDEAVCVAV